MSAENATHMGEYLGIELLDAAPEAALARLEVSDRIRQPYGIVHGGAYATLAETLCSWATFEAVRDDGMLALGQSNSASFVRPISRGLDNCGGDRAPSRSHDLDLGLRDQRRLGAHSAPWCG